MEHYFLALEGGREVICDLIVYSHLKENLSLLSVNYSCHILSVIIHIEALIVFRVII